MHQAHEADVRVRQRIVDGRRHHRANGRRDAARDLLRNEHVGHEREMRPVLLGRADRHDDGVMVLQEFLDLGVRHFAQEDSGWLHAGSFD